MSNLLGTIPAVLSNLSALTYLKLDNNYLKGSIPDLGSLHQLRILHLQNNYLSGEVPATLAHIPNLKSLFLQNNQLQGIVPPSLENKSELNLRLSGNPELCFSNGTCFSSPARSTPPPSPASKSKTHKTLIVSVTGGVALVIFITIMALCFAFKKIAKAFMPKNANPDDQAKMPDVCKGWLTRTWQFGLKELELATGNFTYNIGEGAFGPVYYGRLADGQEIAVKVKARNSQQGITEFCNEVEFLSRVHHRNIVSLIGFHYSLSKQILIYEHISGGTLDQHLHSAGSVSPGLLCWMTRLNIALDAAKGLSYLHYDCCPTIIHRDIKSSNILLTEKKVPKLADFGLSRLGPEEGASHVISRVQGTLGYLDPEYHQSQKLTQKSDVYSFGVVLLELISGRETAFTDSSQKVCKLCDWARSLLVEDRIEEIIDPQLGTDYKIDAVWKVAELAMFCVEPRPTYRPNMDEVVQELKEAISVEKKQ